MYEIQMLYLKDLYVCTFGEYDIKNLYLMSFIYKA